MTGLLAMNDLFTLRGKTALITGASSGLGQYFATVLAQAGARVVIGARRADKLAETAEQVRRAGGDVCEVALDVLDADSIKAAFATAEAQFGVVDVLVNNAGVSRDTFLLDLAEPDWDTILDTNLKGVWLSSREAVRRMQAAGISGSIINIASILSFGTTRALGAYMASKAGVVQLTRAMALEWAEFDIRCNVIAPGFFPTEMTDGYFDTPQGRLALSGNPMKRTGELAELSGPLLLLASDASSYMNGTVIAVDGGHLCRQL
jgi:NAD(P)-dependent dehydrogenase (short-subunit alcohol dehydrogenase family)